MIRNLWKKEPNTASQLLVDLFAGLADRQPTAIKRADRKSNTRADEYRQQGNQLFQQNRFREAIEKYNECLCYAEPAGDQIAFAYANRAACFLRLCEYEHCLADIEAAIAANYPARLMEKLLKRKADCLAEQQVNGHSGPTKPKLSYAEDANFPGMANVLQLRRNVACGRHVVAKRDIPVGKTVLIESSFVSVTERPTSDHHCERCQRAGCSLMPCPKCTVAMFCSAECMNDGRAYHDKVCGFDMESKEPLELLTIQSLSQAIDACNGRIDELMAFVADVRGRSANIPASMTRPLDKYRAFLQMSTGPSHQIEVNEMSLLMSCRVYKLMMMLPAFQRLATTLATQRFLMHLVHAHWMTTTQCDLNGTNHRLLVCLPLISSMISPNCYPNTLCVFVDDKVVHITLRPIAQGERLFVTYAGPSNMSERQRTSLCGFPCQCSKCVPVRSSLAMLHALEANPSFQRIRQLTFVDIADDTAAGRRSIQMLCADMLDFFGKWPHNSAMGFVMHTYELYVKFDYGNVGCAWCHCSDEEDDQEECGESIFDFFLFRGFFRRT